MVRGLRAVQVTGPKLPRPLRPDDFKPPSAFDGRTPAERIGIQYVQVKGRVLRLQRVYEAGLQKEQDRRPAAEAAEAERRRRGR